jgi:hypothetical protein
MWPTIGSAENEESVSGVLQFVNECSEVYDLKFRGCFRID